MQADRDFRSELDALDEGPSSQDGSTPAAPQNWTPSTPLAREIVQSPIIDQIDIRKQVEDEEKRESARQESSPLWQMFKRGAQYHPSVAAYNALVTPDEKGSFLGTAGELDEAGQKEWIAHEKSAADRSLAFWDGLKKNYLDSIKRGAAPLIDYSPQGLLIGKAVGGDAPLSDQFGGWLDRSVAKNITTAKKRKILAEQMELGEIEGPKYSGVRASFDDVARGLSRVGTTAIKGIAYGVGSGEIYKGLPVIGDVLKGMEAVGYTPLRGEISKAQESWLYKVADFADQKAKELFPEDQARQEEFRKQLAEGAGSLAGFMGIGYAALMLGRGPAVATIASGGLGALSQAGSMTDDALKKYLDTAKTEGRPLTAEEERKATEVWLLGLGIGATEAVPLANFFAGGHSGRFIRGVLMQASEEGSQEWVQAVLENVVAQRYYDPDRQWDDNAWDGAAVGFLLGAKTETGRAGIAKLKGKKPEEPAKADEPAAPPMAIPDAPVADVLPMMDGEDRGKGPRSRTTKPVDPDLDKYRQQIEAIVPPAPDAGRRVLGKGLEELAAEGGPGDAIAKVAGVVSKKLETGKVPTFQEMLSALPKDERGDPDMGRLADELDKVGVRAWNGLNDDQRRQIYEAVAPVVQAVEADPRGALEAVGDAVRTVVEAAEQPVGHAIATKPPKSGSARTPTSEEIAANKAKNAAIDAQVAAAKATPEFARQVETELAARKARYADGTGIVALTATRERVIDDLSRRMWRDLYEQKINEAEQPRREQPAPPSTADLRTAFDRVLSSRTKRSDWAKTIGASKEQLDALVNEALSDGRLKKTKAGGIARTGKKVALPASTTGQTTGQRQSDSAVVRISDALRQTHGDNAPAAMDALRASLIADGVRPQKIPANAGSLEDWVDSLIKGVNERVALRLASAPPTLSPGQQTGRTMDRSAEKRLEAVKSDVARRYASRLIEAGSDLNAVESAIKAMQQNSKVGKAVLAEIVKAYGGVAGKPKTPRAAYGMIRAIAAERAARGDNARPEALPEPAGGLPETGVPDGVRPDAEVGPTGETPEAGGIGSGGPLGDAGVPDAQQPGSPDGVRGEGAGPGSDTGTDTRPDQPRTDLAAPADAKPNLGVSEEELAAIREQAAADRIREAEERAARTRSNYRITEEDAIGSGGPKAKIRANLAAIETLKQIEEENRPATEDEKKILVKYVGWGAFSQPMFRDYNNEFARERARLQNLMTPEEYKSARASTINAHYTSPDVIKGMWTALEHLGFKGGRVLEPSAGIGHFIGMQPESMRETSQWTAVELDTISGRITKALYGGADVRIGGFEAQTWPDDHFDLAISNVPFDKTGPSDPRYKTPFSLHDYFFVKALDKVRPGGIVAFITSSYSMDKTRDVARREMEKRGTFLGAIRLPGGNQGAFKANAGTDVTTDIIFFRKRLSGEPVDLNSEWRDLVEIKTPEGPTQINGYFAAHPEMMLGKMRLIGSMYSKGEPVLIGPTSDIDQRIAEAAQNMPADAMLPAETSATALAQDIDTDVGGIKEGAFYLKDGEIYRRVIGVGVPQKLSKPNADRVRSFMGMRDLVDQLFAAQGGQQTTPEQRNAIRAELGARYDEFVKKFGPINLTHITERVDKKGKTITTRRRPNFSAFEEDPSAYKVAAIELYDEKSMEARKAAIFTEDVIAPYRRPTITGPADALAVSLNETGRVDMKLIAEQLGVSEDEAPALMGDAAFLNPKGEQWQTATQYLAGDVVQKLQDAKAAVANGDQRYQRNVDALAKVQPEPLTRVEITVPMGASWVPTEVYEDFVRDVMGVEGVSITLNDVTKKWRVSWTRRASGAYDAAQAQWGTDNRSFLTILEATLNSTPIRIEIEDADGNKTRDIEAEEAIQAKSTAIYEAFTGQIIPGAPAAIDGWIWQDEERAQRLEALYNQSYNRIVKEQHDGSHLTFPGLAKVVSFPDGSTGTINLTPARTSAIWRIIQNGNTLIDHVVGAGKTWTSIMAVMEMKRLGQIRRPMFVVPNHMLHQFSHEFLQAYPSAKILVADKDSMSKDKRKEFAAKAAAEKWDGIIITHSAFGRIRMQDQAYKDYYEEAIAEMVEAKEAAAREEGKGGATVKDIEKAIKALKAKLEKLTTTEAKDEGITFEELGVDHLTVDEAHKFKKLWFMTRHTRVRGLPKKESQRATDLYIKIRHLERSRPGRSALFLTGTPLSNSMAEIYTMMRFLQHDTLKEYGIGEFDSWAQTFGRIVTKTELAPNGRTFRDATSFSSFVNIPELSTLYGRIADTQTAESLKLPRPTVKGGGPVVVASDLSEGEEKYIQSLIKEMESLKGQKPVKGAPNFLSMFTQGLQIGTDMRLVNPDAPFNPKGKIAKATENILRIWQAGNADSKSPNKAQLVFLDMGVPGSKGKASVAISPTAEGGALPPDIEDVRQDIVSAYDVEQETDTDEDADADDPNADAKPATEEDAEAKAMLVGKYNLYADIKRRLVAGGVPAEQIEFIHDANTDDKKAKLFEKVRNGDVRILLGSSEKMGVGTNVQKRLIALHHIDSPWTPAEVEQRDGRILRQGNLNKEIEIYRYVTKRSFDSYRWQILETKSNFIGQFRAGARGVRIAEEIDAPLPEAAELKAAATGDPRIVEHADLSRQVRILTAQQSAHAATAVRARQAATQLRKDIEHWQKFVGPYEMDALRVTDLSGDNFKVTLNGAGGRKTEVTKRKDAGEAIKRQILSLAQNGWYSREIELDLGTISGFEMGGKVFRNTEGTIELSTRIKGTEVYKGSTIYINEETNPVSLVQTYERLVKEMPSYHQAVVRSIAKAEKDLPRLDELAKGSVFPKQGELEAARARMNDLARALSAKADPAAEAAKPSEEQEEYVKQAIRNLMQTSRTAKGTVDTSASPEKAGQIKEGLTGEQAANAATRNFEAVIRRLHSNAFNLPETGQDMVDFVNQVAIDINQGILKEGALYRPDDSPKYPYTAVADLPLAMEQFGDEFVKRLSDPLADPIETAAWVEWRTNLTDHPWADGVGKTSKALAAIPLMRAGLPLPEYRDNKEFFANGNKERRDPKSGAASYLDDQWQNFLSYYRTLMPGSAVMNAMEQEARQAFASKEWTEAQAISASRPQTDKVEGYGSLEWALSREYVHDGQPLVGVKAVVEIVMEKARSYIPGGAVRNERFAVVVLGLPGSGKSTISGGFAALKGAAVLNGDDTKEYIPEYDRGRGSMAVHEEASMLTKLAQKQFMDQGANLILEKTGSSPASITKLISGLRDAGYEVEMVMVDVPKPLAMVQAVNRFKKNGRTVPSTYFDELKTREVFNILRSVGASDGETIISRSGQAEPWKLSEVSSSFSNAGLEAAIERTSGGIAQVVRVGRAARRSDGGSTARGTVSPQEVDTSAPLAAQQSLAAIGRAYKAIEQRVKAGASVPISAEVTDAYLEAAIPHLDLVPKGIKVGALSAVRPIDPETKKKASWADIVGEFRSLDGSILTVPFRLRDFPNYRAGFHRGSGAILFFGISRANLEIGVTESVMRSRIAHEAVHAVWKFLPRSVKKRLFSHAETLGVLDMQLGTLLRSTGEAVAGNSGDARTLRSIYSKQYEREFDLDDRIQQEAVAHLRELATAGFFTDAELAPVRKDMDYLADPQALGSEIWASQSAGMLAAVQESKDRSSLARHFGATRIEDIGPNDPHPGRVLAFHGTVNEFDQFDVGRSSDFGVHFGTAGQANSKVGYADDGEVNSGGRILPAVLDLKSVVTMDDFGSWDPLEVANEVEARVPAATGIEAKVKTAATVSRKAAYNALADGLTAAGIDGIRYSNGTYAEGPGWSYIVWEPGKVLSATSGNMLFALGGGTPAATIPDMPAVANIDLGFPASDAAGTAKANYAAAKAIKTSIEQSFSPGARKFVWSHPARHLRSAMASFGGEFGNADERAAVAELTARMPDVERLLAANKEMDAQLTRMDKEDTAGQLAAAAAEPRPADPAQTVYHGTPEQFSQYSGEEARKRSDAARDAQIDVMFVTPSKEFAEKFGNALELTLEPGFYFDPLEQRDLARLAPFINKRKDAERFWKTIDSNQGSTWGFLEQADTLKELQRLGYDGVRMREEWYDSKDRRKTASTIAVFSRGKVTSPRTGTMMFALGGFTPESDIDSSTGQSMRRDLDAVLPADWRPPWHRDRDVQDLDALAKKIDPDGTYFDRATTWAVRNHIRGDFQNFRALLSSDGPTHSIEEYSPNKFALRGPASFSTKRSREEAEAALAEALANGDTQRIALRHAGRRLLAYAESKNPDHKKAITYRWVGHDSYDKLKVGDTFTDPAFMSTTKTGVRTSDIDPREANATAVLRVNSWSGLDIEKSPFIQDTSLNSGEREVLLPPGRTFTVTAAERNAKGFLVIDLDETVPSEGQMMFALGSGSHYVARDLDSLGFYSKALEAARGLKQERGTPEQMLAQLKKAGVKDAEIEATGLATLFKEKSGSTTALESDAITLSQNEKTPARSGKFFTTEKGVDIWINPSPSQLTRLVNKHDTLRVTVAPDGVDFIVWDGHAETHQLAADVGFERGYDFKLGAYHMPGGEIGRPKLDTSRQLQIDHDNRGSGARLTAWYDRIKATDAWRRTLSHFDLISQWDKSGTPALRQGDRTASPPRRALLKQITKAEIVKHLEENRVGLRETQFDKYASHSLDPSNPTYRVTVLHGNPGQTPEWRDGHFYEVPNYISHMQTSMVRHEGRDVFLVDQLQSGLGQNLRDQGGGSDEGRAIKIKKIEAELAEARSRYDRAEHDRMRQEIFRLDKLAAASPSILRSRAKIDDARTKAVDLRKKWQSIQREHADVIARLEGELYAATSGTAPGHPLVNTTDQWTQTTLRRAIRQAVEVMKDAKPDKNGVIGWMGISTGDGVLTWNPGDRHGMNEFYNKIVPKNLRNLLTRIDPSIKPQFVEKLETPGKGLTNQGHLPPPPDAKLGFTLFPLTDKVRQSVMEEGQPMFAFSGMKSLTANLDKLDRAKAMEGQGHTRADIWFETGWFKHDGRWFEERDDREFARVGVDGRLDQVAQHPSLFKDYPSLANIPVGVLPADGKANASYRPMSRGGIGSLLSKVTGRSSARIDITRAASEESLLEEIQHAIDDIEGGFKNVDPANPYGGPVTATSANYVNAPFEQLARAAVARMNMTPEERRARPPWLDFKVQKKKAGGSKQAAPAAPAVSSTWFRRDDGIDVLPERVALEKAISDLWKMPPDRYSKAYAESLKGGFQFADDTAKRVSESSIQSIRDMGAQYPDSDWSRLRDAMEAYIAKAQLIGHNQGPPTTEWNDPFVYSLRDDDGAPSLNRVIQTLKDTVGVVPTQTLLGVTIKAGDQEFRLNPRGNVAGQTMMPTGAVGTRKSRHLEAIAHETAHYLETTLGAEILDLQRDHQADLMQFYDARPDQPYSAPEAFAEFFRTYLTNPSGAQALAPELVSAFEDVLEANGMLDGINDTQALYQDWLARATPEELASDVVSVHAGNSWTELKADRAFENIPGKMATAYTNTIDDLNPLQKIVRKLLETADRNGVVDDEGRPISLRVAENPYKIARMFRGSYGTGYSWLTKGIANRGERAVAYRPLSKALETLFGSSSKKDWDPAMYQTAGQYLISKRALAEYERLEQKEERLGQIDDLIEQGSNAWRQLSLEDQSTRTTLERREAALIRSRALLVDRRNALKSAEGDLSRIQERIEAKKDDVLAAQMARDQALTDRRRRDLAILERDSQRALRETQGLIEEFDTLSTGVAMLTAEIDQLRERGDGVRSQLAGVDEAMTGLRREREATEKRGASRAPTKEPKSWHADFIAKTEADPKYARIKDFAALVYEFSHGMLNLKHQHGLISDDLFNELSKRKDWYVPFQRDMTDASPEDVFFRGAGIEKWSPVKKFDGSDRAIINPLETMAADAYTLAQQIAFNSATDALARLAERAGPGSASIAQVLTREESAEANAATFDRVKNIAMSMGIDEADALRIVTELEQNFAGSELSLLWSPATKGPINLPTVPLYRNGERILVRFTDPEFGAQAYNAFSGMGKETAGLISELLGYPSRLLQQGVTTHPTFIPRNLFRDIFDAWIKTGALPIVTQVRGVAAMRDPNFFRGYLEAGGITGGRNLSALTSKEKQVEVLDLADKAISKGNITLGSIAGGLLGAVAGGPLAIVPAAAAGAYLFNRFGALETVESVETMTRLGVAAHAFKRAKQHNPNLTDTEAMLEAAFVARDVFDWNRRGSRMIAIVRTITFLNAQIQGMDAAYRRIGGENDRGMVISKHMGMVWRRENDGVLSADEQRALGDAYKTWARMALYTGMLLGLYALATSGGDDDDRDKAYQDIKDRTKSTHSWLPQVFGTDLRLPKAFEWALPANAIEAIADKIRGRDPHAWDRIIDSMYEIAVPPTVPQGLNLIMGLTADVQIEQLTPWVKRLLGREVENTKPRQVVADALKKLDPEAQFDAWSSQLSIDVAKAMAAAGVPRDLVPSPKKIDFILRTGGYWGQDVQRGYQVLKEAFGGRQREAPRISDLPVIAGFTGVAARQSRSRDEMYQLMSQAGGQLKTAAETYKNLLAEQGVPAEAAVYLSKLEPEERVYAILAYHGSPNDRRTHPLERLIQVDGVANKIRKDIILDRLAPIEKQGRRNVRNFDEKISLTPRQQTQMHEIFERLQQAEAWNSMILMNRPGWQGKKEIAVEPILAELRAANPDVADLYNERLTKTKARSWDEVKSGWPELRERVLRDGVDAF